MTVGHPARLPVLALGMLALMAGLVGGIGRLGLGSSFVPPALVLFHGPLMVSGFLGTVIGLERAVGLGRRWAYGAPLATGLGALALAAGVPEPVGPLLMTVGSVALVAVFVALLRIEVTLFLGTMTLGALCWVAGNGFWLAGSPVHRVVLLWGGFLVLTIAGERLELTRLSRPSPVRRALFMGAVGTVLAGLVVGLVAFDRGVRLTGLGMLLLGGWLLRFDVARRTVHADGLTRYIAMCLLAGHGWLVVSGALALGFGGEVAGLRYDAVLHALFLGFVFSMIFGHAPIIFPSVLGVPVFFRRGFYVHLTLLHATVALRVAADVAAWGLGRTWGGLLNVLTLLLFVASTVRDVG